MSIHCKYCGNRCIKNGMEKNGKQRYKCNSCKKSQQSDYRYHAYDQNLNQNIIALTKEGVGIKPDIYPPLFSFLGLSGSAVHFW